MRKKRRYRFKTRFYVFCTLGVVILLAGLLTTTGALYAQSMLGKIHYVADSRLEQRATTDLYGKKLMSASGVTNILLIGTDSRKNTLKGGRSDSMILISLNGETKKIVMTSFMRDSYVTVPGHGKDRLNAAYSYGGADLLVKTIEQNFDIGINRYVIVNFYSFIDIVDRLGGVNITVTAKELPALNSCVRAINKMKGKPINEGLLKKSGKNLLLTGKQALGYARIRHVGNADFERTERQRVVLSKILEKMKRQNVFGFTALLDKLLPDITTNLTKNEIWSLLMNGPAALRYTQVQSRVPAADAYEPIVVGGSDVLKIDRAKNIADLKATIYGK